MPWSSKANTTTNNTIAVLLDNGNLVLSDASNSTIIFWESFDHMTDTFLPGARMGRNKVTGRTHGLVSNKNSHDLSPGIYSGHPSPTFANYELLLAWNSSVTYWSSGQWKGQYFTNMPEMSARYFFLSEFVSNDQQEYFTYWLKNETLNTRYVLDVSGQGKMMIWSDVSEEWISFYAEPGAQCDVYVVCGPFTVCREDMLPFCNCMKGFSIRSHENWELGDRTGGCSRNIPLNCGSNSRISGLTDKFYAMSDVRFPDHAKHREVESADECEQACLSDCSCYAYSYNEKCNVWNSELLNVAQRYNGSAREGTLYLRLAAEELKTSKQKTRMIIGLVIAATIFTTSSLLAIIYVFVRRKRRHRSSTKPSDIRGGLLAFRYKDLQHATRNFSEKLGSGSFGSVFKGVLPDSTVIAVKRLDGARQGEKEFRAEVRSIGLIQHINLVKLIGFCCQGSKRLLVYEYMPNHSLDTHLFQSNGRPLCWSVRYKIALGVARGLAYLHENCQDRIVHCDIKPQNILLDASFVPKIADFGMAKFIGRDFSRVVTTMRGTIGYLAPEWISEVLISSKVDVYSYGMVLLETIFGRRNSGEEYNSDTTYLPVQVVSKLLEGNVQCLLDQNIHHDIDLEEVERACRAACWCIQDHESQRVTMGEVVQILEGLTKVDVPPMPKSGQVPPLGTANKQTEERKRSGARNNQTKTTPASHQNQNLSPCGPKFNPSPQQNKQESSIPRWSLIQRPRPAPGRRSSSWARAAPERSPTRGASSSRPRRRAPSAPRPSPSHRTGTPTTVQIILTHEHADVVLGLDDVWVVQPSSHRNDIEQVPIFLTQFTMDSVAARFPDLVKMKLEEGDEFTRAAQLDWRIIEGDVDKPFVSSGLEFVPLPVMHGEDYVCLGFLFGRRARVAYLSDVSRILPRTEHAIVKSGAGKLDLLVLETNRLHGGDARSCHLTLSQSLDAVKRICPKKALLLGMNHEFEHYRENQTLAEWSHREGLPVQLAHDGQRIFTDL